MPKKLPRIGPKKRVQGKMTKEERGERGGSVRLTLRALLGRVADYSANKTCQVCGRPAGYNDGSRCSRHQNMYMPHGHPKHRNIQNMCEQCNREAFRT